MARRRGGARALMGADLVRRENAEEERRLLKDVRSRLAAVRDATHNGSLEDSAHVLKNDRPAQPKEMKTEKEQKLEQVSPSTDTQLVGGAGSSERTLASSGTGSSFETIFSDLNDSLRDLSMTCPALEIENVEETLAFETLMNYPDFITYPSENHFHDSKRTKNWEEESVRDPYYMEGLAYAEEANIHALDHQLFAIGDPFESADLCTLSVINIKDPFD